MVALGVAAAAALLGRGRGRLAARTRPGGPAEDAVVGGRVRAVARGLQLHRAQLDRPRAADRRRVLIVAVRARSASACTLPQLGRRTGLPLDACLIVLLFLAVPNLVIFASAAASLRASRRRSSSSTRTSSSAPPTRSSAAGRCWSTRSRSTGSGRSTSSPPGSSVMPIGNGTLGLIEGVLSALVFAAATWSCAAAGASRLLAAGGDGRRRGRARLRPASTRSAPCSSTGRFRFGLPIGVLVGAVARGALAPAGRQPAAALQLADRRRSPRSGRSRRSPTRC